MDDPALEVRWGIVRPEDGAHSSTHMNTHPAFFRYQTLPYTYRRLWSLWDIRLIEIMPYRINGCIACKVHTIFDYERFYIRYEALSYLWGNKDHTRQVYLADHAHDDRKLIWRPYPLHENLWQFLNHAWQEKMFGRRFWTDYLCLNQNDHKEIARQIPRMGSIYSGAEQVVAWIQVPPDIGPVERQILLQLRSPGELDETRSPTFQAAIAESLICAENWRRVWIVQEIALARRVWVIYSDVGIDFDDLMSELETSPPSDYYSDSLKHVDDSVSFWWNLCGLRKAGGKMPMWKLRCHFKGYQSSRPADQVYGLLGLVAQKDDGTSPIKNIPIDYDKPLREIWLDVLFESSPPWEQFREMILGTPVYTDWQLDHQALADYLESSRTSERHKELAYLTLRVNYALYLAIENLTTPTFVDYTLVSIYGFVISGMELDFEPTIQQVAAILGFSMPTTRRVAVPKILSGWQCAAHRNADGKPRGAVSHSIRTAESVHPLPRGYLHRMLQVCEKHSESCGGSAIVFEMPHIGFYMSIETFDDHSRGNFRLEIEDRGSMGEGKIDL